MSHRSRLALPALLLLGCVAPAASTYTCADTSPGNIICLSETTFNICDVGNVFAAAAPQSCAPGTVCCAQSNECNYDYLCPGIQICAGEPDGHIVCLDDTTLNYCVGEVLVYANSQSCAQGTVCCHAENTCVQPGTCNAPNPNYTNLPPFPTPTSTASAQPTQTGPVVLDDCRDFTGYTTGSSWIQEKTFATETSGLSAQGCAALCSTYPGDYNVQYSTNFEVGSNFECICIGNLTAHELDSLPPSTSCIYCVNSPEPATTYGCGVRSGDSLVAAPIQDVVPLSPYTGSCSNVPAGDIVCLSSSTFNICDVGGVFADALPQFCAPGTVCCAESNTCDFAYNCPSVAECANLPSGHIVCTTETTFNICNGGVPQSAFDQTCAPGTVCCEHLNTCVWPGQCPYAFNQLSGPSLKPFSQSFTCNGSPPGSIVCLSDYTFNICDEGGVFATALPQSCALGTVCCASNNSCDYEVNCPGLGVCSGLPDGHIACLSDTTLNYCVDNVLVYAVAQSCPQGTVCCESENTCVHPGDCGAPNPTFTASSTVPAPSNTQTTPPGPTQTLPPPPPPTYDYNGTCTGVPPGDIVCLSRTTFNICDQGEQFATAIAQHCAPGTVCCAASNACDFASNCPSIAECQDISTGHIVCTSETTFNICNNGVPQSAFDQSCAQGTTCCQSLDTCVHPGQCPKAFNENSPSLQFFSNTVDCTSDLTAPGSIVCLSEFTFNICDDNLGFGDALPQTCAEGTVCCAYDNTCNYADACVSNSYCNGLADGDLFCFNDQSYNYCVDQVLVYPINGNCGAGFECCQDAGDCVPTGTCQVPNPYTGQASRTEPPAPTYTGVPVYDCALNSYVPGDIVCWDESTFNVCNDEGGFSDVNQYCAEGTICCPAVNACVFASDCPSSSLCNFKSNGASVCSSATTYGICLNGDFDPSSPYDCPPDNICCPATNDCKEACDCPSWNQCSGVPDGHIACITETDFDICQGGQPAGTASQTCAAGTVCCETLNACVYDGDCPKAFWELSPSLQHSSEIITCADTEPGQIICLSEHTFNICDVGNVFANALPQTCAPGTVCCAYSQECTFDYLCPSNEICQGEPNGHIVCLDETTLNYCVDNVLVNALPQSCAQGTVCCHAADACVFPGTCPEANPTYSVTFEFPTETSTGSAQPTETGPVVLDDCRDFTGYTTGSSWIQEKTFATETSGLSAQGCAALCSTYPGDYNVQYSTNFEVGSNFECICIGNLTAHELDSLPPSTSCIYCVNSPEPATTYGCGVRSGDSLVAAPIQDVVPLSPYTGSCSNVPAGDIVCLSAFTFNICDVGGVFADAVPQSCAPGTVCCAESNTCDFAYNCPSVAECEDVPTGHIACVTEHTFNICNGGVPESAIDQSCAPGTVCCQSLNTCAWPGQCPKAFNENASPGLGGFSRAGCGGVVPGDVVCLSEVTFNICDVSGEFASALPQTCAPGTVCCAATGSCDYADNCPGNGICAEIPTGHIACLTDNTLNYCVDNVLVYAVPQSCPQGTVCCEAENTCVRPGTCSAANTHIVDTAPGTSGPTQSAPTTSAGPEPSSAPVALCDELGPGAIVCLSRSTFNICDQGGVFADAVPQACAPGTVCCAHANGCDFAASCPGLDLCGGVPTGHIACTSDTTFNLCNGGVPAAATDQACAPGTVCCQAENTCVIAGECSAPNPGQGTTLLNGAGAVSGGLSAFAGATTGGPAAGPTAATRSPAVGRAASRSLFLVIVAALVLMA